MNNWRCDIGKHGYWSVRDLMESIPTPEEREEFVSDRLHDVCYIYKHPDRKVSASYPCSQTLNLTPIKHFKGAFRSMLVLEVYSLHLRKISSVTNYYGHQIGALALAAAAICQCMHFL